MYKKPIVIVFIGNVGAGKSTHISLSFTKLREKGYKVHTAYIKTFFIITPLLSKLCILREVSWRIAVALDLLLNTIYLPLIAWIRTILISRIRGKNVVLVEEHLIGSLVDYFHAAVILNLIPLIRYMIRFLVKISQMCLWHAIVYLKVDKNLLKDRWRRRRSSDESKTYLLSQDLIFQIVAKHYSNVLYVDTSKDLRANAHSIFNFVLEVVKKYETSHYSTI
jgi:adenylate kinase family enzyme